MANPNSWENVSSLFQAKQTRILYPAVHLRPQTKSEDSWVCVSSEDFVTQLVDGATRAPDFDNLVSTGSDYRLGLNALMGLLSPTAIQVGSKRKCGFIDDAEGAMTLTSFTRQQCSDDNDAYAETLIASCLTERVEGILEWKPSNEFRKSSSKLVAQLDALASDAEKLLSSKDCRLSRPSYNQVSHLRLDPFGLPSTHTRPAYCLDRLHLQADTERGKGSEQGHCASFTAAQCHA